MRKYVLGIDLGAQMGVAKVFEDGTVDTFKPKVKNDYIGRMRGVSDIVKQYASYDCLGVCIERPFGKFRGMDVMQGMAACAALAADRAFMPWELVHLSSIKKHATGKGNAKKPDMQAAAKERWGVDLSEDEADAAWIAAYALDNKLFV